MRQVRGVALCLTVALPIETVSIVCTGTCPPQPPPPLAVRTAMLLDYGGAVAVVRSCGRLGAELHSNTWLQSTLGIQRERGPSKKAPSPAQRRTQGGGLVRTGRLEQLRAGAHIYTLMRSGC